MALQMKKTNLKKISLLFYVLKICYNSSINTYEWGDLYEMYTYE